MRADRLNGAARATAAWLGTLPAVLLASVALGRHLPLAEDRRFAVGFFAVIPMWIAGGCAVYLVRKGWKAWLVCAAAALVCGAAALL